MPQTPTSSAFEITTTQPTQVETSTLNITTTSPTTLSATATPTTEVIIKITANGFEPKEVEITKGKKVTWINEQPNPSWPASDVHPTHEVYPGSSIKKCGTPEQNKIFDACHGLKQGESWSFVFNEVGEWYYHDHLNPSWKGEIVVK
jgi:plastocyanin